MDAPTEIDPTDPQEHQTAEGARIFAAKTGDGQPVRIVSCSAFSEPHAWVLGCGDSGLMVSADDARFVIAGLERFLRDAAAGFLDG